MLGNGWRNALVLLAVVLAAWLGATRNAAAQGRVFPPPMSTDSLERALGRYVRPSAEVMPRIEAAHDRYLEEYRRLEDNELEPFAKEPPAFMRGGDMGPWMRKYVSLRGRVNAIDATLLNEIAQIVGGEQAAGVERIRWVREAEVLRTGLLQEFSLMLGGAARVDVADIVYGADLDEAQVATLDPFLRDYQSRMLAVVRKGTDETERNVLDLMDRMKAAGIWGEALQDAQADPEKAAAMATQMMDMMRDFFATLRLAGTPIMELNGRAFRDIRGRLPYPDQLKLEQRWLAAAYPSLSAQFPFGFLAFVDRAKSMPGVTDETRQAIDRVVDDAARRLVASFDEEEAEFDAMMAASIESQIGDAGGNEVAVAERQQRMMAAADARRNIISTATDSIRALLPPEAAERLQSGGDMSPDAPNPAAPVELAEGPGDADDVGSEDDAPSEVNAWMAGVQVESVSNEIKPYAVGQLQRLLGQVEADDSALTVAETLHGDYLARYQEEVEPLRSTYHDLRNGIHEFGEDGVRYNAARADEANAALRRLAATAKAVDDDFFAALASALGDEHRDAVTVARVGQVTGWAGRVTTRAWMPGPDPENPVDVVAVINDGDLAPGEWATAAAAVAARADTLMSTSEQAFEAVLAANAELDRMQRQFFDLEGSGVEDRTRAAMDFQRHLVELVKRVSPITGARAAAQRDALAAAMEAVPEAKRSSLQRAWNAAMYPTLMTDPGALFRTIERIERMSDLTDAQREQVARVLADYQRAYDLACDGIVAAASVPLPEWGANDQSYWHAVQTRSRSIERMKFERGETTARAASALRKILTPEQAARFRALEDPSKKVAPPSSLW